MVGFNPSNLKNFKDEPWTDYGKGFKHLVLDLDDVDDADLLITLPEAVRFIDEGLRGPPPTEDDGVDSGVRELSLNDADDGGDKKRQTSGGGVFVHCAAGKSRSVAAIVAYLLWRYPNRFDPNVVPTSISNPSGASPPSEDGAKQRPRKDTAVEAVGAALAFVRRSRPMAEPNPGFMDQLALWWEMGCPRDVEAQPAYQRWAYRREVDESLAVGQAPTRLRFEDEEAGSSANADESGLQLRCKKCRRTLVTAPFIVDHESQASASASQQCQHFFVEPLSWMRGVLEHGELNGRLLCPNAKCGAGVGRYDWKGFRCSCGAWVTPAFSLQRAKVDEQLNKKRGGGPVSGPAAAGIRMPPGSRARGNL